LKVMKFYFGNFPSSGILKISFADICSVVVTNFDIYGERSISAYGKEVIN